MAIGVKRKSEGAVGLGISGIHTKGGARFGESVLGIIGAIKQVRKLAVGFGETRHQPRRFREFVERLVDPVLPAQDGSKDEMQQGVTWRNIVCVVAKQSADTVFGVVEFLIVNQSGNLCSGPGADAGGGGGFWPAGIFL